MGPRVLLLRTCQCLWLLYDLSSFSRGPKETPLRWVQMSFPLCLLTNTCRIAHYPLCAIGYFVAAILDFEEEMTRQSDPLPRSFKSFGGHDALGLNEAQNKFSSQCHLWVYLCPQSFLFEWLEKILCYLLLTNNIPLTSPYILAYCLSDSSWGLYKNMSDQEIVKRILRLLLLCIRGIWGS